MVYPVVVLATPEMTRGWGKILGFACRGGEIIWLSGDLGAGKTCLVKGIAAGLGVESVNAVTSPTFTLHNQYAGSRLRLDHVDLYRLIDEKNDPDPTKACHGQFGGAMERLGLHEWCGAADGVFAVEWPEALGTTKPSEGLWVSLAINRDDSRTLAAEALDGYHEQMAAGLFASR